MTESNKYSGWNYQPVLKYTSTINYSKLTLYQVQQELEAMKRKIEVLIEYCKESRN